MATLGGQVTESQISLTLSIVSIVLVFVGGIIGGIIAATPALRRIKSQNQNDLTAAQNNLADAFEKVTKKLGLTYDELLEKIAEVQELTQQNIQKDKRIQEQDIKIQEQSQKIQEKTAKEQEQYEQIEFLNTRVRDLIALLKKWISEAEAQGYKFSEFDKNLLDTGPLNKK